MIRRPSATRPIFDVGKKLGVTPLSGSASFTPTINSLTYIAATTVNTSFFNQPTSVKVRYPYVFAACQQSHSVNTVDVSNPYAPVNVARVADFTDLNNAYDLALQGDYAYVACRGDRFAVVNIFNPLSLILEISIAGEPEIDFPNSVAVQGDYAYLANGSGHFTVIDISNPLTPAVVASITGGPFDLGSVLYGVYVEGDYAYVSSQIPSVGRFVVIDISDPTDPQIVAAIASVSKYNEPYRISRYDSTTLLGGWLGGVTLIDVSDPENPQFGFAYDTNDQTIDSCLWNGFPIAASTQADKVEAFRVGPTGDLVFIDNASDSSGLDGAFSVCADDDHPYCYVAASFSDRLGVVEIT